MRIFWFILALAISSCFIWLGSTARPFGSQLPALGSFFSPFTGFWQNAVAIDTWQDDEIAFSDERARGQVFFDERAVPHIFAPDLFSATFLQGYLHAKDRMFQMDVTIRAAGGRLSEILGERTVERDRTQRRKGMLMAAATQLRAWESIDAERDLIEAYTAGVNAYLANLDAASYPLEYKLIGFQPEPWTTLKTALLFQSMAEVLCFRHHDLGASNSLALLGAETFSFLYPEYNPLQSPIIPAEQEWSFTPIYVDSSEVDSASISSIYPYQALAQETEHIGSNNWAISGQKSRTGKPILSNDPHLRLTLPSVWYEMQIHTPELNCYGVSLPGSPGIIIGFNESIAWGMTNVGQDVVDWYRIKWADAAKSSYYLDDQIRSVNYRYDTIRVRGRANPIIDTTKLTFWGPLVYEDSTSEYHDLALQWIAHQPPGKKDFYALGTYARLMQSSDHAGYRDALNGHDLPAQNFVFAAKDGDIAITVNGRFPIKDKEQGRFIQDGSRSQNAWKGYIPREQVPAILNPSRQFVASANQNSTSPDYPYYYNGSFDDYRGRYINRRLKDLNQAGVTDMQALQLDNYSILAEELLPVLLNKIRPNEWSATEREMLDELAAWDFRFSANVRAPILFTEWMDRVYDLSFDEVLGPGDSITILEPETWRMISLLTEHPDHILFDHLETPEREKADDIVNRALQEILAENAVQFESLRWGTYQDTQIPHLANLPGLGSGTLDVGGFKQAPNAITSRTGPSWRMVVSLEDDIKAWGVYPGGASGNPGSPYYNNAVETWRKGEYYELFFMRTADDRSREIKAKLVFK